MPQRALPLSPLCQGNNIYLTDKPRFAKRIELISLEAKANARNGQKSPAFPNASKMPKMHLNEAFLLWFENEST